MKVVLMLKLIPHSKHLQGFSLALKLLLDHEQELQLDLHLFCWHRVGLSSSEHRGLGLQHLLLGITEPSGTALLVL